uniref:hypothetical protein n=1 Tax=Pseudoerythrocladia kornmannii TaxID=753682 RepID=UPI001FCDD30E|nr:hypothetical protein MW575_mgp04 [Pseudoerythrocladia kornmannii]UNJ19040.1 hypothetical protein [Pseudoerythrocladia kornmannii]
MSRLLLYHKNIVSFDQLTLANITHPKKIKLWTSLQSSLSINHENKDNKQFLIVLEWCLRQHVNLKPNYKNKNILKVRLHEKNIYLILDQMLILGILNEEYLNRSIHKNYNLSFKNWSTILEIYCRLNFDLKLFEKLKILDSRFSLKKG